ncbi:recombinase family protein [Salinicoccus halodurans]|uniref:Resolvase n=1 Tax=Salinicoccus halodurans TaxID=407035 RepID=A0A0F7HMI6_9STAP|nr:recombinase family protein [Salinicoccus halodurans]AKG74637.1 resolvase [Salinicoccus halodurans]SFK88985.1 Site-specific DNA recombinase [Salinicoccus halodurans]
MKYGYIRPIDLYDDIGDQKQKLNAYTENIFIETHTDTKHRHQLDTLLHEVMGLEDELIVTDLCILADSTQQLVDIINFSSKGVIKVRIINPGIFITPTPRFTFQQVLNEISNFQSDVVRFRTKQGISSANKAGKQIGRPKRSDDNMKKAIEMYMSKKYTLDDIKAATNISRATLYRHLES